MPEDPGDHGRLLDVRDQTQAATTPGARQHVDPKRAGHEDGPRLTAGWHRAVSAGSAPRGGAIPTALLESEMFGRERGAYTGAVSRQVGRFELADGSTTFLDEIGDLPLDAQVKLLQVVEDRVVERLGSTHSHRVDVRIIAATNRSLEDAVVAGTFRENLFYRLNVFSITVPPLRERVQDIPTRGGNRRGASRRRARRLPTSAAWDV